MFVFMLGVLFFARHSDSILVVGAIEILALAIYSNLVRLLAIPPAVAPLRLSFDKTALHFTAASGVSGRYWQDSVDIESEFTDDHGGATE